MSGPTRTSGAPETKPARKAATRRTEAVGAVPAGPVAGELPLHELARIFPEMDADQFEVLKQSIARDGQREPIWTHEGAVVDGRHRLRACRELGVEPRFEEWPGGGSLVEFVRARNFARRHLSASQRALVAAKLEQRDEAAIAPGGRPTPGAARGPTRAGLPGGGRSRDHAARRAGVSGRSVQDARRLLLSGLPGLVELVDRGRLGVADAAVLATLGRRAQRELVEGGPAACRAAARETRRGRKAGSKRPDPRACTEDPSGVAGPARSGDGSTSLADVDPRRRRAEERRWLAGLPAGRDLPLGEARHLHRHARLFRGLRAHLEAFREAVEAEVEGQEAAREATLARPLPAVLRAIAELPPPERWVPCPTCRGDDPATAAICPDCGGARYRIPDAPA